jgi:hypothetical protein
MVDADAVIGTGVQEETRLGGEKCCKVLLEGLSCSTKDDPAPS